MSEVLRGKKGRERDDRAIYEDDDADYLNPNSNTSFLI